MNIQQEQKLIFEPILRNYFDENKHHSYSKEENLTNVLHLLNRPLFSEVQEFLGNSEFEFIDDEHFNYARSMMRKVYDNLLSYKDEAQHTQKLKEFCHFFEVNDLDMDCIQVLVILAEGQKNLKKVLPLRETYQDQNRHGDLIYKRSQLLKILGHDVNFKGHVLQRSSPVLQAGLVEDTYFDRINISESLYTYLKTPGAKIGDLQGLKKSECVTYPLSSFHLPDFQIELCKKILQGSSPASILIIGSPGLGKSCLAAALGKEVSKEIMLVPPTLPGDEGVSKRRMCLSVAALTSNSSTQIICADECEELVDSRFDFFSKDKSGGKEWLNHLLDTNRSKLILIGNYLTLDPSSLRRISLVIQFKALTRIQRKEMLTHTLSSNGASGLLNDLELHTIIEQDKLSQGVISLALKDARAVSENPVVQKEIFLNLLESRKVFDGHSQRRIGLL